jgi:G3E family GTPase
MIPVTVLTGFLGSGKTTLLARMLKSPALARTAVIINEFGEVGIDHDLVEAGEESFVQLQTGCLCCSVRGDIEATMADLLARRAAGTVPPFEHFVIETSGLADPAPILNAVMTEDARGSGVALANIITTVDAATGLATLAHEPQSVRQVAVADRLVVTKSDLDGVSIGLRDRIAAINPRAEIIEASHGDVDPARLFAGTFATAAAREIEAWTAIDHHSISRQLQSHVHGDDIRCFAIRRERPIPAVAVTLMLEALADHCGSGLLRLKGIVGIAEHPERPAVIHGVQHVFHAPVWLDRWPSDDRSTRLVLIGRGLSETWVQCLITALETEIAEIGGRSIGPDPSVRAV